jgi:nitrogen fixation/metabolism regulation signal transduction histidine kinase
MIYEVQGGQAPQASDNEAETFDLFTLLCGIDIALLLMILFVLLHHMFLLLTT